MLFIATCVSAEHASIVDKAGGGPSELEYKLTEQANTRYKQTGDKSGYQKADEEAYKEKLRDALSKGLPDSIDR